MLPCFTKFLLVLRNTTLRSLLWPCSRLHIFRTKRAVILSIWPSCTRPVYEIDTYTTCIHVDILRRYTVLYNSDACRAAEAEGLQPNASDFTSNAASLYLTPVKYDKEVRANVVCNCLLSDELLSLGSTETRGSLRPCRAIYGTQS